MRQQFHQLSSHPCPSTRRISCTIRASDTRATAVHLAVVDVTTCAGLRHKRRRPAPANGPDQRFLTRSDSKRSLRPPSRTHSRTGPYQPPAWPTRGTLTAGARAHPPPHNIKYRVGHGRGFCGEFYGTDSVPKLDATAPSPAAAGDLCRDHRVASTAQPMYRCYPSR